MNALRRLRERLAAEPERAVFVVAAAALTAAGAKRAKPVEVVSKPLVMLSLQRGLWRSRRQRTGGDNALLAVATTASLVGDVLMMEEEFAPTRQQADRWLVRGASAFAVNHLALIALSVKLGARPRPVDVAARAAGLLEGFALLASRRRHLLGPLGAYSAVLASMSAVVAAPELDAAEGRALALPGKLEAGGLAFLASDSMILHRQVFFKSEGARAAGEAFVLATYCSAQRLLIDGLDAASRRAAAQR